MWFGGCVLLLSYNQMQNQLYQDKQSIFNSFNEEDKEV